MELFPAIDLQGGTCVRLTRGDFNASTSYDADPVIAAQRFAEAGASWLHIVDLDGARNQAMQQTEAIKRIAKSCPLCIQAGGGVRTQNDIERLLCAGATRVIVGSLAVQNPALVQRWIKTFGADRIVIALDVRIDKDNIPYVLARGWQEETQRTLWQTLTAYKDCALRTTLCTDIARDGMLSGPNLDMYREMCRRFPTLDVLASGGIASLNDIDELSNLPVAGAITGKALYENRFDLREALFLTKGASRC